MPAPGPMERSETVVHRLWLDAGPSCDGDSFSLTNATRPSVEDIDIVMGTRPA